MSTFIHVAIGVLFGWLWFADCEAQHWVEGSTIGVRVQTAREDNLISVNSYASPTSFPAGEWHTVDVTAQGVPLDARAVYLSGLLVITHGAAPGICDMAVSMRAFGSTQQPRMMGQVVEAHAGGGQRSTFGHWVPLSEGKLQFYWTRSTWNQWSNAPDGGCSYGMAAWPQAYVR